jgi:thymidine kinase
MWSGKSSALLAFTDRCRHQGRHVDVFKAARDDRYSTGEIVTHAGWKIAAVPVDSGRAVIEHVIENPGVPDVVVVDEAFMIDGIATAVIELYRVGATIAVSSLDMSAHGKPFQEIQLMMPWATQIEKLTAVCTICRGDARYTWKKGGIHDVEVEVGGSEIYEPRCILHHPIINRMVD